jgi:antitoxin (DNA-binding transcriptional repressor) of toxin-antitoxin stability system
MILGVRAGEPFVIASQGDPIANSQTITGLSDPTLMGEGRVYAEAADQTQRNRAYSFSRSAGNTGTPYNANLLSDDLEVFPSSLTLDRTGRFAFLSLMRPQDKSAKVTAVGEDDGHSL